MMIMKSIISEKQNIFTKVDRVQAVKIK